jgi:hypothetical protein
MKTAMQELIDELDLLKIVNRDKLIMVKYIISACLEKEKEQMIDFYNWMRRNDSAEEYFHYSDEDMLTAYLNK